MFNKWIFPDNWNIWTDALSQLLHQRSSWRLATIFTGIIFAKGRKTITSWFRAARQPVPWAADQAECAGHN